ncbi:hypothetical protein [Kamptonema formosum]|uniref:hypothetical protein n=1 Tax=Kamptonema formosum TaxID=331992 RepID=UPI000347B742|nr:hypothetical protein [Oscillatoria sp. PCC 10802]
METANRLYLIQDFFLAVECRNSNEPEILEVNTHLDLTEFRLTEEEIHKLSKIMKKLELRLTDKFSQATLAASVTANIGSSQLRDN